MPTESAEPPPRPPSPLQLGIKCSLCGAGALSESSQRANHGIVLLNDPIERICGGCLRAQDRCSEDGIQRDRCEHVDEHDTLSEDDRDSLELERDHLDILPTITPVAIPTSQTTSHHSYSHSLPVQHTRPWTTAVPLPPAVHEVRLPTPPRATERREEDDVQANPLLDVGGSRIPNHGRGALYPGSIFRGTQTSGRSAYEVEVRFLEVDFPESSLSGYLSISHLTDSHPHLTTFFTAEIIGPKYGFITGPRLGATEHDDMRHWGRFEQFRRPSTRADMLRPDLFLRDPLPDISKGEMRGKERDFVFLRIKEKFLVPDHTVRDISGASFAGFYFAMVDLSPSADHDHTPVSPTSAKVPLSPTSPTVPRRQSTSEDARSPSRPAHGRRRQSSHKLLDTPPSRGEATIRGYYFHSLNQEPFQELFLTHVPSRSSSTMELR